MDIFKEAELRANNVAEMYRLAWEIVRREKGDAATMKDVDALVKAMDITRKVR
jgi:hypothetical protein